MSKRGANRDEFRRRIEIASPVMATYKRRLRAIVKVVPTWVSEEILSASEHIGDQWAALHLTFLLER